MITTSYNSKRSSLEKESMVTSKKNTKKLVTSLTSHLTSKSESFAPQHFYFWCYLLKTHIIIFSSNGICATEQITEPKQSETEAYWPSTQKLGQADPGDHRIKAMSSYNKNKKTGRSETETFQTTIWAKSFWFMLLNTNQANSLSCLQRALLFIVYEQVSF